MDNLDKCQYCGASRVVRPVGEYQYACRCDDPDQRPSAKAEPAAKICPFCDESDFDLIGLKTHLLNWCKVFTDTFTAR